MRFTIRRCEMGWTVGMQRPSAFLASSSVNRTLALMSDLVHMKRSSVSIKSVVTFNKVLTIVKAEKFADGNFDVVFIHPKLRMF